mmetsp:Transcript_37159/g.54420  ORF Transcript_37159/g.54420 Transcript_37159/m.54420 type:complete len:80 (-) Transcript_37159:180-419(-)
MHDSHLLLQQECVYVFLNKEKVKIYTCEQLEYIMRMLLSHNTLAIQIGERLYFESGYERMVMVFDLFRWITYKQGACNQ